MWFIWGPSHEEREVGVVAEQCPHCGQVAPCSIVGRFEGLQVYLITIAETATEAIGTCGSCGGHFRCDLWRYKEFVPPVVAASLTVEALLERTNPALRERLGWTQQQEAFAADPRFLPTVQAVEQLRLGPLRARLMKELRRWDCLDDGQREELARTARESARALAFADSVANRFPRSAGCLPALLACIAVWSAFLWAPAVRSLPGGILTGFAGLAAGAAVVQLLLTRGVRGWANDVLIPEGRNAGIDFGQLLVLIEDLPPPGPNSRDGLTVLKEYAATIREELVAAGEVAKGPPP
jgi:hypothetical protein